MLHRLSSLISPRWKAGCWALIVSFWVCASILEEVVSGIFWSVEKIDSLPPVASASLAVMAVILLSPFVTTALIHLFMDWRLALARLAVWWLLGFRMTVIGLLVLMPVVFIYRLPNKLQEAGLIEPGSLGGTLSLLPWVVLFFFGPLWAWWLVRRLPQTFLGRDLFETSDLDRIEQNPDL